MSAAAILGGLISKRTSNSQSQSSTVKALTSAIFTHLKANRLQKAVSLLFASPFPVPYSIYASLFQLCSKSLALVEARKVESHLVTFSPTPPIFLFNRAIETYGTCGNIQYAREMFDQMPQKDGGTWNAMITAYTKCGIPEKAMYLFKDMKLKGVQPNEVTFASVLGSCGDVLAFSFARQMHGLVVKYGFNRTVILGNALVDVYGKCNAMIEALSMFNEIENSNDVTWNVIFLFNRAIETYGKCGNLQYAKELFDQMPKKDGGTWNAMITACTKCGSPEKALYLFKDMKLKGVQPNEITFASVLGSCGDVLAFSFARQMHGLVLKYGFSKNVILGSALVDVYGKCNAMVEALSMFNEIENSNDVTWNVIIRRCLEAGNEREAVSMFFKMFQTDIRPFNFTFSNALIACTAINAWKEGMRIHGVAVKLNLEEDKAVSSALCNMYAKCGKLESARMIFDRPGSRDLVSWTSIVSAYAMNGRTGEARRLFEEMPEQNVVSWNAMLAGYTHSLQWEDALEFVYLMFRTTEEIDHITLGLLLNVCAGLSDVEMGKQVHGFIYRHGFSSNMLVGNALLDMYGKCGAMKSARVWFSQMSRSRDSISWNSLLTSYARHQQSEQAILLFGQMQWEAKPNKYTFGILLTACANVFALDQGKQIHGFMIRNGYDIDIVLRGVLLDMYSKCNCIMYALYVFREAASRDLVLWNTIILACYHNKRAEQVLKLFRMMKQEGVKPDHVTFQGVLLACMYEGHIQHAKQYFNSMVDQYCLIPRLEHYECMIELFSRFRCKNDLENFVRKMPCDPTLPMLERVFDVCKEHGWSSLGKWAAERLNELSPTTFLQFEIEDGTKEGKL
ncbi:Tetratricopeptide repeat (TPR)-like superfamily protein [Euphorbia peplus]|nr:Tetratricopeptide repeat (TPR)-like superfamily protein [Euphorbia peplus]